ncbi:UNVERIFIED_CONTAM: hypothetical protein HDU68_007131 [Siphonaria sp. JEL0065]|nr:hypothetical protein HDU68_007131 [Siphonaria sp. JEL0065]
MTQLTITIKTPQSSNGSDLVAKLPCSATVLELKAWLTKEHLQQPPVCEQRLVAAGKLLVNDGELLRDALRFDEGEAVVHLVVSQRVALSMPASPVSPLSSLEKIREESKEMSKEIKEADPIQTAMAQMVFLFHSHNAVPHPRVLLVGGKPHLLQLTLNLSATQNLTSLPVPQQHQPLPLLNQPLIHPSILSNNLAASLQQTVARSIEPTSTATTPNILPAAAPLPAAIIAPAAIQQQQLQPQHAPAPAFAAAPPNAPNQNQNPGIAGQIAAAFHHLFGDHDDDEFGDPAALLAVQQQEAFNAVNGGGNAANGEAVLQQALRRRVEHPFYLAIKLSFLVFMITRGGVSNRSVIIMGAASVFFLYQFRAWWIQLRPQQAAAARRPSVLAAQQRVLLNGEVFYETTVFQETWYFIHDFFASLFPESDDYLYNRERRGGDLGVAHVAAGPAEQQPAIAFM